MEKGQIEDNGIVGSLYELCHYSQSYQVVYIRYFSGYFKTLKVYIPVWASVGIVFLVNSTEIGFIKIMV